MNYSRGAIIYNIAIFVFVFNLSIGMINAAGIFTAYLDPDVYPGLDETLCITVPPDGFGGTWKNVGGAGYKCYLDGKAMSVSEELIDKSNALLQNESKLFDVNQDPGPIQIIGNLAGSFGNWIQMAFEAFRVLYSSVTFPAQFMLTLWPCESATFAYTGTNLLTTARGEVCTANPSIDDYETIVLRLQQGIQLIYILTIIQFVSNRSLRSVD